MCWVSATISSGFSCFVLCPLYCQYGSSYCLRYTLEIHEKHHCIWYKSPVCTSGWCISPVLVLNEPWLAWSMMDTCVDSRHIWACWLPVNIMWKHDSLVIFHRHTAWNQLHQKFEGEILLMLPLMAQSVYKLIKYLGESIVVCRQWRTNCINCLRCQSLHHRQRFILAGH